MPPVRKLSAIKTDTLYPLDSDELCVHVLLQGVSKYTLYRLLDSARKNGNGNGGCESEEHTMLKHWQETIAFDLDLASALCVLCVGSTEQHSDYLPLGTDSYLGDRLTALAAERAASMVVMLPTQRIGFSPHHRAFPGCLTLRQETMARYLYEICVCIQKNGAKLLLLVNAHGGNQSCLQMVVNEVGSRLGMRAVLVRYWDLVRDEIQRLRESAPGGMGHAGEFETSLMLHFCPELVDRARITTREPAEGSEWHHPDLFAANKVYLYKPFDEYSSMGNVGQPAYGSAEKGAAYAELIAAELARLMDDLVAHGM